jgi:hypothetical protein
MPKTHDEILERRRRWAQANADRVNARRRELYASGYRDVVLQHQKSRLAQCPVCDKWLRAKYLSAHLLRKHPATLLPPSPDAGGEGLEPRVESS